jgi:Adenine specific DNA methylase Mod
MQKLELTWIGKGDEPVVEPRILLHDASKDYGDPTADNMLIHGDNLLALKALEQEFAGRVKCIYIDPPYNTGSAFEYYDDNLEHSLWLSLMRPRLIILRNLLSEDGCIWISIDDTEQAYLKVICDEIFGRNNFVQTISNQSTPNGRDYGSFAQTHDFIHIYSKNIRQLKMNKMANDDVNKYNKEDEEGAYYLHPLFNSNSNFHKGNRPNLYYPFYVSTKQNNEGYYDLSLMPTEDCIELYPPLSQTDGTQFVWRWGKEKATQYLNKEIVGQLMRNGEFRIAQKMRVKDKIPRTIWVETEFSNRRGTEESQALFAKKKFPYPKPEPLIERILTLGSNPGDLVLDSFLGSGTTAAVAHKMGRQYIGIELGEHCYTHCLPRLKAVVDGEQGGISKTQNWQGGGGFKFYELAPTLIVKDPHGQSVINDKYNAQMLVAAIAKLNGYDYAPDADVFWKQGKSQAGSYIFVTTEYLTAAQLDDISRDLPEYERLLVCAPAFDIGLGKRYENINIRKIPQSVLDKCAYGADNYNLNIVNPPELDDDEWEDGEDA